MTKRKISILLALVICCLLVAVTLVGCGNKGEIRLSKATQNKIIAAFVNAHINDQYPVTADEISLRCYGAFHGVYVLFVDVASGGSFQAIQTEVIADVKFIYPDGQTMIVYSDGEFYTIAEAYDNNILSYQNLVATQENYKVDNLLYNTEG